MTIDPKAAELAKALADAVAVFDTPEYQDWAKAAQKKADADAEAERAFSAQQKYYNPPPVEPTPVVNAEAEPERYYLPPDNEFATPKENGALPD